MQWRCSSWATLIASPRTCTARESATCIIVEHFASSSALLTALWRVSQLIALKAFTTTKKLRVVGAFGRPIQHLTENARALLLQAGVQLLVNLRFTACTHLLTGQAEPRQHASTWRRALSRFVRQFSRPDECVPLHYNAHAYESPFESRPISSLYRRRHAASVMNFMEFGPHPSGILAQGQGQAGQAIRSALNDRC